MKLFGAEWTKSVKHYVKADKKTSTCMKSLSIFSYVSYSVSSVVATILNGLYNAYVKKNYDPSTWNLPLRVSMSFDDTTILEYFIALSIQIMIGLLFLAVMYEIFTHFVSWNCYIEAMSMHLKDKILSIDDGNKKKEKN